MPNWLIITATIITALAGAAKIHETFYPDLATRKRQLKRIGSWLLNIAAFAVQIWVIAGEIKHPMPTTHAQLLGMVFRVSLSVSMLLSLAQLQCLNYFVGRILRLMRGNLDNSGHMVESTGHIIGILKSHERAILTLSASPALDSETRAALAKLLD